MRIAFATAEMHPFAMTGGLGDVLGSLPHEISKLGHSVKVFLPFYSIIDSEKYPAGTVIESLKISVGDENFEGAVLHHKDHDEVDVYFMDFPMFFDRERLYGTSRGDYPDNDVRFIAFQKACFETLKQIDFSPDVIHCHDWHTALIPFFLKKSFRKDEHFQRTKSVFTIHNLAYQGVFKKEVLEKLNLKLSSSEKTSLLFKKKFNFMKVGLTFADAITTVSEKHAQEIQTRTFGCGLESVLKKRTKAVSGILNGIQTEKWNPETDANLTIKFKPNEQSKKMANKGILQKEAKVDVDPEIPVFGMVTRLAEQKGFDLLKEIASKILKLNLQLIVLGTGDESYEKFLGSLAKKYPGKVGVRCRFDENMARRIYAGADVFLMPSRFEPCGLGQMISLRYGTVPLVRQTGGLADTIHNFDPKTGKGEGIVFKKYQSKELLEAIKKTIKLYKDKTSWQKMIENGMKKDFSWETSAKKYVELYRQV